MPGRTKKANLHKKKRRIVKEDDGELQAVEAGSTSSAALTGLMETVHPANRRFRPSNLLKLAQNIDFWGSDCLSELFQDSDFEICWLWTAKVQNLAFENWASLSFDRDVY